MSRVLGVLGLLHLLVRGHGVSLPIKSDVRRCTLPGVRARGAEAAKRATFRRQARGWALR
jgi:hypothetical protein